MKRKLKQHISTLGFGKLYHRLLFFYNEKTCSRFECSIGDILLKRGEVLNNQLLLTSRVLDIEMFLSGKDQSFPYQNAISYKEYGKNHREEGGNRAFRALIESYQKDGYHNDSYITCDKDMELMDGNHRMGLHVYEKIEFVNVRRISRKIPFPRGAEGFYKKGAFGDLLNSDFMERIFERYETIQKWLVDSGNTFCAVAGEINCKGQNPLDDISRLVLPLKKTYKPFEGVVNGINARWSGYLLFSLNIPSYNVKNGRLYSEMAIQIEDLMKERYGGNIPIILSHNCSEGKKMFEAIKCLI